MEAIVALPVFLLLFSVLFQLCLIAMGQIFLQYAVFCAARTGAVRHGDMDEMRAAAALVLRAFPGNIGNRTNRFELELMSSPSPDTDSDARSRRSRPESGIGLLQIHGRWDFPLIVPMAAQIISGSLAGSRLSRGPTLPLQSAWSLPLVTPTGETKEERKTHARQ